MNKQKLFIIGATGNVGRAFVKQIINTTALNSPVIIGLASRSEYIFNKNQIDKELCNDFIQRKSSIQKTNYSSHLELLQVLQKNVPNENVIFIDTTAADLTEFYISVLTKSSYSIVTANKGPLATNYAQYKQMNSVSKNRFGYRCCAMAGADTIPFIQGLNQVEDIPTSIEGCFSGTLGYITSNLDSNKIFSEIVYEAMKKGFTEPHPRDDLNGLDVARKLLIIARTAGYAVEMSDIVIKPFIPESYLHEDSVDTFLSLLQRLDAEFITRVQKAHAQGKVLRYVARLELQKNSSKPRLEVGLQEVSKDSALGQLQGTSNKCIIISKMYPASAPYIITAPGAGRDLTAQNARRELFQQIN